jgi:hypothetical protein
MLSLLALLACDTTPPPPEVPPVTADEVTTATSAMFCTAAAQAGLACTASGAQVTLDAGTVTLSTKIETFLALPGKTIGMGSAAQELPGEVQVAAWVTAATPSGPLLTMLIEASGSEPSLEAARAAAIEAVAQRYMVSAGLGVLDGFSASPTAAGLRSVGMDVPPTRIGETGHTGWAAYPVLKGHGFDPKLASKLGPGVRTMVAALAPFVADTPADGLHTVFVRARLGGGGENGPCPIIPPVTMTPGETVNLVPLKGTVEVDGVAVGDICALSEPVAWPLPNGVALLEWEQVVVIGPAPAAAAQPTEAPPPG